MLVHKSEIVMLSLKAVCWMFRGQQHLGRDPQSKKRPREGQPPVRASLPAHQDMPFNHKASAINQPRPSQEQQTQHGSRLLPASDLVVSSDRTTLVKASSKTYKPANTAVAQSGTALPAGTKPPGRASSRAPLPAAKGPGQPAFIRIGEDMPRTAHRPAQVSFAPGQLGIAHKHSLGSAAQSQLHASRSAQGKSSQLAPAVSTSTTTPVAASRAAPKAAASPAVSPAAALSQSAPSTSAAQAVHGQDGDALASQQGSYARWHDRLRHATIPSLATDVPGPEVTAAAGEEAINHVLNSAASITAAIRPGAITPAPADVGDLVGQQHDLGSSGTTAEVAGPGSVLTLSGGLQQTVSGVAAAAPRVMLPTSRRKRKAPKAAKTEEPVKSQHSWQELLALSNQADSTAPDRKSPSGVICFDTLLA